MTPEGPIEIRARRGVLVAAGGFEGNAALRAEHGVPGDVAWTMAPRRHQHRRADRGGRRDRRGDRLPRHRLVLPRAWSSRTAAARSRSASGRA